MFGIVSTILGVLGLAVLILDNVTNGIIILQEVCPAHY